MVFLLFYIFVKVPVKAKDCPDGYDALLEDGTWVRCEDLQK